MVEKVKKNNENKKYIIRGMITGFITGGTLVTLILLGILNVFYFEEHYVIVLNISVLLPLLFIVSGFIMIKKRKWMLFFLFAGLSNVIIYILVIFIVFLICSGALILTTVETTY